MIETKIVKVTPILAKAWLETNSQNRPISRRRVEMYKSEMLAGRWGLSNDAICFSASNKLLNGQHRLLALIESGLTIEFVVATGYNEDAFFLMDCGMSRTASQMMSVKKIRNSAVLASMIKKYLALKAQENPETGFVTLPTKIQSVYEDDRDFLDYVASMAGKLNDNNKTMNRSEYGGYIYFLVHDKGHDTESVFAFFEEFADLKPVTNTSVSLLRRAYLNDAYSQAHMTAKKRAVFVAKAWNAYITGKEISRLNWNPANEPNVFFK